MLEMIYSALIRPIWQLASRTRRRHYEWQKNGESNWQSNDFMIPSSLEEIQDIVEKCLIDKG